MAVLSETDRQRIWRGLMRYADDQDFSVAGMTKAEFRAAVDDTDDWIEANQGSFNSALPLPARTAMNAEHKTILFSAVAAMRVSPAFAKSLFGDLD